MRWIDEIKEGLVFSKEDKKALLEFLKPLWMWLGIAFIMIGPAILGLQIFGWLRTGTWVPIPTLILIEIFTSNSNFYSWLVSPDSWFGFHGIVLWVLSLPLWLAVSVITWSIAYTVYEGK